MKEKPGDLVKHILSRASESLEEAKILADSGHWNTCVSRLYYSCFYAASALLEKHGLSSSKHSGEHYGLNFGQQPLYVRAYRAYV